MTLEEELEEGRRQWTIAWRRFARQWTQPQLLRLAEIVMGGRYLHSSQISGFASGKLREPGPKVFVTIGRLNQAVANQSIAIDHRDLWQDKRAMVDREGNVLDAVACFRAFTGDLDLGFHQWRAIPEGGIEAANRRLGRFTRSQLASIGVDFIDDLPELIASSSNLVRTVLLGETVDADDFRDAIYAIEQMLKARGVNVSLDQLWGVVDHD